MERDRLDRLKSELEEVRAVRDEKEALDRRRRRGDDLPRAYAGLLHFYLEPELPGLLVARYPTGEISFAPLSRASREAEIAVQQGDDPRKLLFGYLEWARRGYHFFAAPRELLTTGRDPAPPKEFLHSVLAGLPYRLTGPDPSGHFLCAHLSGGERAPYLEVAWPAASVTYRVCSRCARPDRHLLSSLSEGVAGPDPEGMFPVEVSLNVDCRGGAECLHARLPTLSRGLRKRYVLGKLSDSEVIQEYRQEAQALLSRTPSPLWVAGGRCFGGDRAAFVDALRPTAEERKALDRVLPRVSGYFDVAGPSASQALERLWRDHAEAIVSAIVPDPAEARELVAAARANPGRVSDLLSRAAARARERAILGALPRYARLAPEAGFVDAIARDHRVHGTEQAERRLEQTLPREGKERGLAYALLLALGRAEAHAWQFSDTEKSFGTSLRPLAEGLLASPSERYDEALGALLSAAGYTGWGERVEGASSAPAK